MLFPFNLRKVSGRQHLPLSRLLLNNQTAILRYNQYQCDLSFQ